MTIAILAATYWEVRKTIQKLGLVLIQPKIYSGNCSQHKIILMLSGMGQKKAEESALQLVQLKPDCLILTGFAGGLQPYVQSGNVVVDSKTTHPQLLQFFLKGNFHNIFTLYSGTFYCSPQILLKSSDKKNVGIQSGSIAVEMESSAVKNICDQFSIPFGSVRSVSDTVDQDLPSSLTSLDSSGSIHLKFLMKMMMSPKDWTHFFYLKKSAQKAEVQLACFFEKWIQRIGEIKNEKFI